MKIHGKVENFSDFVSPKGAEKTNFSPNRLTTLKISEMKL